MPFQIANIIGSTRPAYLRKKRPRINDPIGVNSVTAQTYRPKLLVADGNRRRRAPLLIDLKPSREEINFRLERGLKRLVPIQQIRQQRQIAGVQSVQAWTKHIGNLAFIHKRSHLRLTNRQPAAVLNLFIPHREPIRQNALFRLVPLNDTDELLPQKLS